MAIIQPPITGDIQQDSWALRVTEELENGAGIPGTDGLLVELSDTNHTFVATTAGEISASAASTYSSQVEVFVGTTRLNFDSNALNDAALSPNTYRIISSSATGTGWPDFTIGSATINGIVNATILVPSQIIPSSSSDENIVTLLINVKGADSSVASITRQVVLTKALAGATGSTGPQGSTGTAGTDAIPSVASTFVFNRRETDNSVSSSGDYSLQETSTSTTQIANGSAWNTVGYIVLQDSDRDATDIRPLANAIVAHGTHIRIYRSDTVWSWYEITAISTAGSTTKLTVSHSLSAGTINIPVGSDDDTFMGFDVAVGDAGENSFAVNVTISPDTVDQNQDGTYPTDTLIVGVVFSEGSSFSSTNSTLDSVSVSSVGVFTPSTGNVSNVSLTLGSLSYQYDVLYSNSNKTVTISLETAGGLLIARDSHTVTLGTVGATGSAGDKGDAGSVGTRGAGRFSTSVTLTDNSDHTVGNTQFNTDASAVIVTALGSGSTPVTGDVVTITYTKLDGDVYTLNGIRGSSTWTSFAFEIDGSLLVDGTVVADSLRVGSVITTDLQGGNKTSISDVTNTGYFFEGDTGDIIIGDSQGSLSYVGGNLSFPAASLSSPSTLLSYVSGLTDLTASSSSSVTTPAFSNASSNLVTLNGDGDSLIISRTATTVPISLDILIAAASGINITSASGTISVLYTLSLINRTDSSVISSNTATLVFNNSASIATYGHTETVSGNVDVPGISNYATYSDTYPSGVLYNLSVVYTSTLTYTTTGSGHLSSRITPVIDFTSEAIVLTRQLSGSPDNALVYLGTSDNSKYPLQVSGGKGFKGAAELIFSGDSTSVTVAQSLMVDDSLYLINKDTSSETNDIVVYIPSGYSRSEYGYIRRSGGGLTQLNMTISTLGDNVTLDTGTSFVRVQTIYRIT